MNVEIGAEAALFPEKEYISGIFVAVRVKHPRSALHFIPRIEQLCGPLFLYCMFAKTEFDLTV